MPRNDKESDDTVMKIASGQNPTGGRTSMASILVAEDDQAVRDFVSRALAYYGHSVTSVPDGSAALAALSERRFDLMLTDVVMPGRSGRQLAEAVVRLKPDVRVLYMTGYTQNAIVHNGVLDSGTHLITKPFTVHQLGVELDALMDL